MAALYRGGYSLLLLPAHWLGGSPGSEYRGVLITNALLAGLVFPLVHVRVIAGQGWPQARQAGARRVWVHRAFGQALWCLPRGR